VILFFLVVVAGLLVFADVSKVGAILDQFNWALLPFILTLTLLDYLLRFMRWSYFLKLREASLSLKDSASIFFSGLAMAITPGKIGETIKAYLVKQLTGVPMSKTLPVVVVERLTDLIAVTLLAAIGAIYFQYGIMAMTLILLVIFAFVLVVQWRNLSLWIIDKMTALPLVRRYRESIEHFYKGSCDLLRIHRLTFAIAISMVAWGSECLGLYIVYYGLGYPQSFLLSSFVFSFSSIAGAISMLPGGLGVTEASMTKIMAAAGIERSVAVSAILLIRFCTLWFGFLVGFIVLMVNQRRFKLAELGGEPCRE